MTHTYESSLSPMHSNQSITKHAILGQKSLFSKENDHFCSLFVGFPPEMVIFDRNRDFYSENWEILHTKVIMMTDDYQKWSFFD